MIDLADHYFKTYAKETRDFDEFLLNISKLAFENGSEDRRYNFMVSVIKAVDRPARDLSISLA